MPDFDLFLSIDNHMKNRTFSIEDGLKKNKILLQKWHYWAAEPMGKGHRIYFDE